VTSETSPAGPAETLSPPEYLSAVREAYSQLYADEKPDEAFHESTLRDLEKLGVVLAGPYDGYDRAAEAISDKVVAACKRLYDVDLANECALGPLMHPSVNARCFRNRQGVYALVIHHGLMALLHKYTKLVIAAHDPSQVVYCNRKDPRSLTKEDLLEWADELGVNYLLTDAARGAMVRVAGRSLSAVSTVVQLAETFVLGHEAGHYLGGHLESEANFVPDDEVSSLQVLAENDRHIDEFEADEFGFEIMQASFPRIPEAIVHTAIFGAFSMMALIGGDRDSESHPASGKRYKGLADRHGLPPWTGAAADTA
jgi:hypothetical protein